MEHINIKYVITISLFCLPMSMPKAGMAQEEPLVLESSPSAQTQEVKVVEVQSAPMIHQAPPSPSYRPIPAPYEPTISYQEPELKRNGLHVNPLSIAFGVFGLGYERVLTDYFAMQVQGQFLKPWYDDSVWGLGAALRPSFFFFRPAPGGMYISPFASLAYSRATAGSVVAEAAGWSAGATIGWSWVLGLVNIRAGAGVQYIDLGASAADENTSVTVSLGTVLPALDLSLGFVF